MRNSTKNLVLAALAVAAVSVIADPAFAAGGEGWEAPATKFIGLLQSGLVKIAAVMIGIGIIGYGAWAAVSGRLEWQKLLYMIIGGILVMAGPGMLTTLLETVK